MAAAPAPSSAEIAFENAALRCAACASPAEAGAAWCASCGAPLAGTAGPASFDPQEILTAAFRCDACGATVQCEPGRRAQGCAFCGSTYVVELPGDSLAHLAPEFVLPFRIDRARATAVFAAWRGRGFFTPRELRSRAALDRLQGIYLPFWTFSMRAESTWEADIGEHWTERRMGRDSKGRTTHRLVQHTEWHPLAGRHHSFHSHHLESGAAGLPQTEAREVFPFDLTALRRYRPELLAGWLAEPFAVPRETALAACQQAFTAREGERIRAFLPGDTHQGLEWTTVFDQVEEDRLLLPFWIGTYSHRGKTYRFVVNGQTGRETGTRPRSTAKIVLLVLAVLVLVLLLAFLLSRS
jgi:hypothetical protein